MNKLRHQLQNEPFSLLVSLPHNDPALARAAMRAGAQGLKIHVNVEHHASGTHFGSWREEKERIAAILEEAKDAPVGIVPGGNPFATPDEFAEMAQLGIDFFDAYPGDAPAWTLHQNQLDVMLAAFHGGDFSTIAALETAGMTMCEASLMSHDDYGKDLNTLDVARYAELSRILSVPFIVPSQKKLVPDDLPALQRAGARGVLIGAIVTGREAETLEAATRTFAAALPLAS